MKKSVAVAAISILLTAAIPPMYGTGAAPAYAQTDNARIDAAGATFA
ncbi:MAG: hypothetical protein IS632_07795, partial [Thaumarchaeota archaeon]|nr:hypothetical protein [Nitrososphaerota archaeon]